MNAVTTVRPVSKVAARVVSKAKGKAKPAAAPAKSKPAKPAVKVKTGRVLRDHIRAGKTNEQALALLQKAYPELTEKTKLCDCSWNRSQLRNGSFADESKVKASAILTNKEAAEAQSE